MPDRQQRQRSKLVAHAAEHRVVPADREEDDQRQHEVHVADRATPALPNCGSNTSLRLKPICWPMISPAHCDGDEDEAHDHAHRQPEHHLPADAERQLPTSFGETDGRRDRTASHAHRQHERQQHLHAPRDLALPNSGANSIIPASRKKTSTNTGTNEAREHRPESSHR